MYHIPCVWFELELVNKLVSLVQLLYYADKFEELHYMTWPYIYFMLHDITLLYLLLFQSSDSKVNRHLSDNESSVFEEKLEEPVHQKEANTQAAARNKANV